MADNNEDPREVPWHPRFAKTVVGHQDAQAQFAKALSSGRPHHAWLIHGPKGIGKATLGYHLAGQILGKSAQTQAWIDAKAHPDFYVLELQLNEAKPRKLKSEISVEDARGLGAFLNRTAATDWRVVLIDAADDLNKASANAILKLVEEPPAKTLIFIISHQPGGLLKTVISRCLRMPLTELSNFEVTRIINSLPLATKPTNEEVNKAVVVSHGSPGRALALLNSNGAKAFDKFVANPKLSTITAIAAELSAKGQASDQMQLFGELLLDHVGRHASTFGSAKAAKAYQLLAHNLRVADAFGLDKKQIAIEAMRLVNDALKAT